MVIPNLMAIESLHMAFRRSVALQTANVSNEVARNSQSTPCETGTPSSIIVKQNLASGLVTTFNK